MTRGFLIAVLLATTSLTSTCVEAPNSRSGAAEVQIYDVVLDTALALAEVRGATPQVQVLTLRVGPRGFTAPGLRPEHYTSDTLQALARAAARHDGITLRVGVGEVDWTRPAEIFMFTAPTYTEDTLAVVQVWTTGFFPDWYSGRGWRANLRWDGGKWALVRWVLEAAEDAGG